MRTHARDRHCRYYLALAERAEPHLFTGGEAEWLPKLDAEADNFRAALDWSIRDGDPAHGLRLAGLLGKYWDIRNMAPEGLDWLESAIAAAGDDAPSRDRALARRAQVHLLADQGAAYDTRGPLDEARSKAAEALAISREAAEPAGVADALLAMASLDMAESHPQRRRRALVDEALAYARKADEHRLVALALMDRAYTVPPDSGREELEQAATALRKLGCSASSSLTTATAPTPRSRSATRSAPGPSWLRRSRWRVRSETRSSWPSRTATVGLEALFTDDLDRARKAFDEELRLCREHVVHQFAGEGLGGLAAIATRRDDLERAALLLGAANATPTGVGDADVTAQFEEQFFAPARAAHGTRDWDEAQARGAQMSLNEAIAFALGERDLDATSTSPAVRELCSPPSGRYGRRPDGPHR